MGNSKCRDGELPPSLFSMAEPSRPWAIESLLHQGGGGELSLRRVCYNRGVSGCPRVFNG